MSNAARIEAIELTCGVTGRISGLPADFAAAFCASLANYVGGDLGIRVTSQVQGAAARVAVSLDVDDEHVATATITTAAGAVTQRLMSFDSVLSAGAARVLVRPIALQLGLAK